MSNTDFQSLGLRPELQQSLADLGYATMTPIQAQALPAVIAGRDVLARARTGSGKTAAFALGLLQDLQPGEFATQALVLCPTRELADQVAKEIRRLAKAMANTKVLTLCGGVAIGPQFGSLERSSQIVVGTCGRILKHLRKGSLRLPYLRTLVLDEADRMLDMGFEEELDEILTFVPAQRQTLLFSATYPETIAAISARVQIDPVTVDVTGDQAPVAVRQLCCQVDRGARREALLAALRTWGGALNLVFCNTKAECDEVALGLRKAGVAALALHGDLEQAERSQVLVRFSNGSATVLVATDVAARGLDIKALDAVFNHELPNQPEVYVHRIGRTGRAGASGLAVSLVVGREVQRLVAIEAATGQALEELPVPVVPEGKGADLAPAMTTLEISGGRKHKLRPGDLVGALTAGGAVPGDAIGTIDLFEFNGFVAVAHAHAKAALKQIQARPVKGRSFRARLL